MPSLIKPPHLIPGGLHTDARGTVSFVNDFDFRGVDRFYAIRARRDDPRGWVGHKRDHKWFTAIQGTVLIAVVAPDDWASPSRDLPVQRFTLDAQQPAVLSVPPGHATAQVMLSDNAILMVFSSGSIQSAKEDDYRFELGTWQPA